MTLSTLTEAELWKKCEELDIARSKKSTIELIILIEQLYDELAREHEIKLEQLNQQKMEAIYFAEKDLLSKK